MNLTEHEIKQIDQVADNLDEWREVRVPSQLKKLSRHGQLIVMVQKQLDYIVLTLLAKMQGVGELVKEKFTELLNQAKLVKTLDADTACFEDAKLRGLAQQLSETLRRIAHNAREELSSEKPAGTEKDTTRAKCLRIVKKITGWLFKKTSRLIGAIIVTIIGGLIVAVLIDILGDFGWIERIKAFIYEIIKLN